jgi:hypothetical protein
VTDRPGTLLVEDVIFEDYAFGISTRGFKKLTIRHCIFKGPLSGVETGVILEGAMEVRISRSSFEIGTSLGAFAIVDVNGEATGVVEESLFARQRGGTGTAQTLGTTRGSSQLVFDDSNVYFDATMP